ncbi:MAG: hypothetical protein ACKO2G_13775 [Verrucomicrobiales bacterium]
MKVRKTQFILTAASALLLAQNADAQTDWKAGGNNQWSNTANWNGGDVPNSHTVDARFNVNGLYSVRSYRTGNAACSAIQLSSSTNVASLTETTLPTSSKPP